MHYYPTYSNERPYSNKCPLPWFENKTHDHVHYMIIKKHSNMRPSRSPIWAFIRINTVCQMESRHLSVWYVHAT